MRHQALLLAVVSAGLVAGPAFAADVELHGQKFTIPDGFTLELVASSPLIERPLSAAFDED